MRFTMYTVSPCIRYAVLFNTAHVVFQYVFFIQKKSCNEKFKFIRHKSFKTFQRSIGVILPSGGLPIIKTRPAVLSLVFFSWWVTQSVALVVWTRYHHNHHHRRRVAGEGRRVVHTPACPRLSDTLMWSWRAMFAGVPSSSRATYANTEMRRRDRRWDSEVRPVRCILHHFGLGRTIGFQAAVPDTSGGKHSSHQLIVRSRCLRRIVTQLSFPHSKEKQCNFEFSTSIFHIMGMC